MTINLGSTWKEIINRSPGGSKLIFKKGQDSGLTGYLISSADNLAEE